MEYELELYHHGIKGQRWGIRRFQNYDGTYTKKGLARYDKAASKYENSKKRVAAAKKNFEKSASDSTKALKAMDELNAAKKASKQAKREMKKSYKQLKNDYRADKGKEAYASGRTISGNKKRAAAVMAGWYLGEYATYSLYSSGKLSGGATMNINRGIRAATALGLGAIAYDNRKLRAYYAHS